MVDEVAEIYGTAEMIVKVKEPQPAECAMLRCDQVLFTYLHLAADAVQTNALIDSGCVAIAYETVTDARGGLAASRADERGRGAACRSRPAPIAWRRNRVGAAFCSAESPACRPPTW